MYKKHYDWQTFMWNVFFERGREKDYIISFKTKEEAQAYCDTRNAALQEYPRGEGIEVR